MQEAYTASFDEASKETRNSLLAVLSVLVESPRFCGTLASSDLLALLSRAAACPDVHSPKAAGVTPFAVAPDAAGHEATRLLWAALAQACEHSGACRRAVVEVGFLKVLLAYTDVDADEVRVQCWLQAAACLCPSADVCTLNATLCLRCLVRAHISGEVSGIKLS
jgi:hypothetical protein